MNPNVYFKIPLMNWCFPEYDKVKHRVDEIICFRENDILHKNQPEYQITLGDTFFSFDLENYMRSRYFLIASATASLASTWFAFQFL